MGIDTDLRQDRGSGHPPGERTCEHAGPLKLELLVVPDCPHESAARELASETLAELGMTTELTTTVIATEAEARGPGFVGSPTFLVDSEDLFAQLDARSASPAGSTQPATGWPASRPGPTSVMPSTVADR